MSDSNEGILQAIYSGQHRQAHLLIQKKIKKYPGKSYYHALNCLCLLKSGKEKEAITQSLELMGKTPSDPETLQLLSKIFTEVGDNTSAHQIYENAVKKYPSYNLIFQWFSQALRNNDIRTIQKATMSLQKIKKTSQYTYWAALSYILVSELPDANASEKSLFPKIAFKLIEELKPQNEQETFVHVKLLEINGKLQDAISLIEEFSKGKTYDLELQILLLKYLDESESWEHLIEVCNKVLFTNKLDDFDTWKYLLKGYQKMDVSLETIKEKLNSISSRNSYLAHLEYAILYKDQQYFNTALETYYKKFNNKLCCFSDIRNYQECLIFDSKFLLDLVANSSPGFESNDDLNIHVNNQKLKLLLQKNVEIVDENFQLYSKFKKLLDKKEVTDYFAGNEFLLMNCQIILQEPNFTFASYKAIVLLEHAMIKDKHEPRLKLMSMKLYNYLNYHDISVKYYQDLKIKMIQHDTLGYTVTSRVSSLSPSSSNFEFLQNINKFYLTCNNEIEESLIDGFEKNAYNKLKGFFDFSQRMQGSIGKWISTLELLKLSKLFGIQQIQNYCTENFKQENLHLTPTKELSDNRDTSSIWKFGTNKIDAELDLKLNVGPKIGEAYLRIMVIIQLLLQEHSFSKAKAYIGQLNKLINNISEFTPAEIWASKIYLAVFKLYFMNANNSADANFLSKNLQIDSIKPLKTFTHPWEVNHNVLIVYEVCRNLIQFTNGHQLPKEHSSFTGEIKKNLQSLLAGLRELQVDDTNLSEMQKEVSKWISTTGLDIATESIFVKLKDYQKDSAKNRRIL